MIKVNKAFTLIEIIFVIIILSILSSIAIPILHTSREDSKIAVSLAEVGMIVSEISSYYTTKGFFNVNVNEMINVKNIIYSTPWNSTINEGILTYFVENSDGTLDACVYISLKNKDGNLTVSNVLGTHSTVCQRLHENYYYLSLLGTKFVGGNRIKF